MLQRNLSWEWKQILKFFHSQCRQKPLVATAIAAKDRLQRKKEYSAGCLKKKRFVSILRITAVFVIILYILTIQCGNKTPFPSQNCKMPEFTQ